MNRNVAIAMGALLILATILLAVENRASKRRSKAIARVYDLFERIESRPTIPYLGKSYVRPKVFAIEKTESEVFEIFPKFHQRRNIWASDPTDNVQTLVVMNCYEVTRAHYCCPETTLTGETCSADLFDTSDPTSKILVEHMTYTFDDPPERMKDTGERRVSQGSARWRLLDRIGDLDELSPSEIEAGVFLASKVAQRSSKVSDLVTSLRVSKNDSSLDSDLIKPRISCSQVTKTLGEPDQSSKASGTTTLIYKIPKIEGLKNQLIEAEFDCRAFLSRVSIQDASGKSYSLTTASAAR